DAVVEAEHARRDQLRGDAGLTAVYRLNDARAVERHGDGATDVDTPQRGPRRSEAHEHRIEHGPRREREIGVGPERAGTGGADVEREVDLCGLKAADACVL